MLRLLARIEDGQGTEKDLDVLWKVTDSIGGKTLCPFGDAAIAPAAVHAQEVPRRVRVPRAREAVLAPGGEDLRGGEGPRRPRVAPT